MWTWSRAEQRLCDETWGQELLGELHTELLAWSKLIGPGAWQRPKRSYACDILKRQWAKSTHCWEHIPTSRPLINLHIMSQVTSLYHKKQGLSPGLNNWIYFKMYTNTILHLCDIFLIYKGFFWLKYGVRKARRIYLRPSSTNQMWKVEAKGNTWK